MSGVPYRAIHFVTTVDPAGTIKHAMDNGCEINRPKMSFLDIIKKKEVPANAKFVESVNSNGGLLGPRLTWNKFNITAGTQKLPAGYELKNDILGFTHVVREGTKGVFYRN